MSKIAQYNQVLQHKTKIRQSACMTQDKRVILGKQVNYEEGVRWYIDE